MSEYILSNFNPMFSGDGLLNLLIHKMSLNITLSKSLPFVPDNKELISVAFMSNELFMS